MDGKNIRFERGHDLQGGLSDGRWAASWTDFVGSSAAKTEV